MPAITWTLDPSTQTVYAGADATLANNFVGGVGTLQDFTFSDGGGGGTFTPASMTASSSGDPFTYQNLTPGTYTITVHAGTGPLIGQADRTATVIVVAEDRRRTTSSFL